MWTEPTMSASQRARPGDADYVVERTEATGWVGWLLFAGIMLLLVGGFQAILGLVGLFNGDFFGHGRPLVLSNYSVWGWIHLALAAIAFATGVGLLFGLKWARIAGVILCILNVIICFAFIGAYPGWALMLIVFSIITAYAIIVHGHEIEEAYDV